MSLSRFFSLAVLLSTSALVVSSPLPANSTLVDVAPRALGYNCGPQYYSLPEADDAWGDGVRRLRNGQFAYTTRGVAHPHRFYNGDAAHGNPEVDASPCNGKALYEFPILNSGLEFTGGVPGPDRVVFGDNGDGSYTYCFLMTHTNAPTRGEFVKCT